MMIATTRSSICQTFLFLLGVLPIISDETQNLDGVQFVFNTPRNQCNVSYEVPEEISSQVSRTNRADQPGRKVEIDSVSDTFFNRFQDSQLRLNLSQVIRISLAAKHQFADHLGYSIHKYADYEELKNSVETKYDQNLCLRQLNDLSTRANIQEFEGTGSEDVSLYQLLDSFGSIPPGVSGGNLFWPGAYASCMRAKIDTFQDILSQDRTPVKTRFCWASLRLRSWDSDSSSVKLDLPKHQVLEVGICLPKTCDSSNYKSKFQLIESLLERPNRGSVYRNEIEVVDLYCLPDEASPARLWYRNFHSATLVVILASWFSFLAYATLKSEITCNEERSRCWYQQFSVIENLKRLFDYSDNQIQTHARPIVEFKTVDGLKVIATISIILAHTLMCYPAISYNEQEANQMTTSPPFLVANLLPAFAVNSFFAITGILFSYGYLKYNDGRASMTISTWFVLVFRRYLRVMPTYAFVVAYLKYLAKFAGSGPFWDYGTSSLGLRHKCRQESWLLTLLFRGNLEPPLDLCVPSSWYLANDFQFLFITPIVLATLIKAPKLGPRVLFLAVGFGYLYSVSEILLVTTGDLRPITKFTSYGFRTYVANLWTSYTHPQHRIPAYLCGLLAGHRLHQYKISRFQRRKDRNKLSRHNDFPEKNGQMMDDWSPNFKRFGGILSLGFAWVIILMTPLVSRQLQLSQRGAKIAVAIVVPAYHVLYAAAVAGYVALSSTGYGFRLADRLLASSFWRPLSKLSLCVLLVNIEVIRYLNQTITVLQSFDSNSLLRAQLVSLVCTYFVSTLLFVTIEAPLGRGINLLVAKLGAQLQLLLGPDKQSTSRGRFSD